MQILNAIREHYLMKREADHGSQLFWDRIFFALGLQSFTPARLLLPSAGELGQPLILSGGLHHANVGQAISAVRPFGVDVSSGVEASRGVKNSGLIIEFCRAVMQADAQLLSKRSTV